MKKSNQFSNMRSFFKNTMSLTGTELREIARLVSTHGECEGLACYINQTHNDGLTVSFLGAKGVRKTFVIREDKLPRDSSK